MMVSGRQKRSFELVDMVLKVGRMSDGWLNLDEGWRRACERSRLGLPSEALR